MRLRGFMRLRSWGKADPAHGSVHRAPAARSLHVSLRLTRRDTRA
jgi:hypothetical protein